MAQTKPRVTVRGEVQSANERGIKVRGEWWNYSRYAPVPHPEGGELVQVVAVEEGRWIDNLTFIEDAKGFRVERQPDPDPIAESAPGAPERPVAPSIGRDAMIARHVALKAAVAYCAARESATTEHILPLAAKLEAWLTRPVEGAPNV